MDITCVVDSKNVLGEGPVWCARENALYWVDIRQSLLLRYVPETEAVDQWMMPEAVTSFALREQGGLVVAFGSGFGFFDLDTGAVTRLASPEADRSDNTFNDGKCDRRGRFWAGTRNLTMTAHTGALYRLGTDQSCQQMEPKVGSSNGLGWSPDNRTFYFGDSKDQTIYAYDFDIDSGAISNRRPFVVSADEPKGMPDGLTVDAEGYVWSAECFRWRVIRYAPDGRIDRIIEMPVEKPSSCMFGGEGLSTLYVTSIGGGTTNPESQPLAGGLFALDVGVKGLPEPRFAG